MRQLTILQRVFIKNKYECTKRPAEVIPLFVIEYPDRPPLISTATIWNFNELIKIWTFCKTIQYARNF